MKTPLGRRAFFTLALISLVALICVTCLPKKSLNQANAKIYAPVSSVRSTAATERANASTAMMIPEQNSGEPVVLALDHFVITDEEGKNQQVAISPIATKETLMSRIKALSGKSVSYPVIYPQDRKHTVGNRKLLTSEITIQLPASVSAAQVANETGLTLVSQPDYAPGFAIFKAKDPLAAWSISEKLLAENSYPTVEQIVASQKSKRTLPNDPLLANQWHLKYQNQLDAVPGCDLNIENAWLFGTNGGVKGNGVRIGIVDDGLETGHPDFVGNIDTVNDKDWNGMDADPNPSFFDDHGTSCAGNAGARGDNGIGVCGTAPHATLVGMRLTASASTDSTEAEAMAYLRSDANTLIHIKSNSWGPEDDGITLEAPGALTTAALQTAATTGRNNLGTIIIWAGGNGLEYSDNSNYDGYANSIYTIAVGACDSRLQQSSYSEPGSNLVVVAPSDGDATTLGITTVDRSGSAGYNGSIGSAGDYADDFGGTSSTTPTVAGICALMLEKNPNLGWRDVQEILIRSARKINPIDSDWSNNSAGFHFNHKFGAGLVDATAAVNMSDGWQNLTTQRSIASVQSNLKVTIPDNNSTGITRSFVITDNIRIEHVTLKVLLSHSRRSDLAVTLTSPSGMKSRLAELHQGKGKDYKNWTFSSVRHWGEMSPGTWTINVTDTRKGKKGKLNAATLTIFGSGAP
jgi:subtilisin-like proprotein convertase family protein